MKGSDAHDVTVSFAKTLFLHFSFWTFWTSWRGNIARTGGLAHIHLASHSIPSMITTARIRT